MSTERLTEVMNNLRFPVSDITEEMVEQHYAGNAVICPLSVPVPYLKAFSTTGSSVKGGIRKSVTLRL